MNIETVVSQVAPSQSSLPSQITPDPDKVACCVSNSLPGASCHPRQGTSLLHSRQLQGATWLVSVDTMFIRKPILCCMLCPYVCSICICYSQLVCPVKCICTTPWYGRISQVRYNGVNTGSLRITNHKMSRLKCNIKIQKQSNKAKRKQLKSKKN